MFRLIVIFSFFLTEMLYSERNPPKFDGLFGEPRMEISNLNHLAAYYLPYNPVVVEIGGYEGVNTLNLAQRFSDGRAYSLLVLRRYAESVIPHMSSLQSH